jgi:hypothetical protein
MSLEGELDLYAEAKRMTARYQVFVPLLGVSFPTTDTELSREWHDWRKYMMSWHDLPEAELNLLTSMARDDLEANLREIHGA